MSTTSWQSCEGEEERGTEIRLEPWKNSLQAPHCRIRIRGCNPVMSTAIIQGGGGGDNGGCGWTMAGAECRIMASLAQPDRCVRAQTAAERDKDQQPQWENTEALIISVAVSGLCNSLGSTDTAERGLRFEGRASRSATSKAEQDKKKKKFYKTIFFLPGGRKVQLFLYRNR